MNDGRASRPTYASRGEHLEDFYAIPDIDGGMQLLEDLRKMAKQVVKRVGRCQSWIVFTGEEWGTGNAIVINASSHPAALDRQVGVWATAINPSVRARLLARNNRAGKRKSSPSSQRDENGNGKAMGKRKGLGVAGDEEQQQQQLQEERTWTGGAREEDEDHRIELKEDNGKPVTRRLEPAEVVAGSPAKIHKTLPEDTGNSLLSLNVEMLTFLRDEEVLTAVEKIIWSSGAFQGQEAAAAIVIAKTRPFAWGPRG